MQNVCVDALIDYFEFDAKASNGSQRAKKDALN